MVMMKNEAGKRAAEELLSPRVRFFKEENMFTRVRTFAEAEGLDETFRALEYMRKQHSGQFRKKANYTDERVQYINHPLLMACQAHAYGISDDAFLAAVLLHDVVEDTGVSLEEIPFSDDVKELVGLVTFNVSEGETKTEAKKRYFAAIAGNGRACVIKLLDRCSNVSTMAGSFSRDRMIQYIEETERYILPLADVLKSGYPSLSGIGFLLKYHILSVIETIKLLTAE